MVSTPTPMIIPVTPTAIPIHARRALLAIFVITALALIVRLVFVLAIDPQPRINNGGDTAWLLNNGRALLDGTINQPPQTGPVYLIYDGIVQGLFHDPAPQLLRVLDCLWGALLCWQIYVIGARYFERRAGLIAAFAIAISPAFIIDAGNLLTEALFMVLLFEGIARYAIWSRPPEADQSAQDTQLTRRGAAVIGLFLALATLTRAVTLLIPLVLILDLLWASRRPGRRVWQAIGTLAIVYMVVVGAWTVYYAARWHEIVIGAQGVAANVFIGTSNWCGPQCIDQQAGITPGQSSDAGNQSKYLNSAFAVIAADPLGYIAHRLSNELDAELQPYNTVYLPGDSIKAALGNWWSSGHALRTLPSVTQIQDFWPKLLLYVFHFVALIGGLLGLLIGLRRFRARFLIYGVLLYFLALHFALTAIPRYLFPIEPIWWLFAAFALITVFVTFFVRTDRNKAGLQQ